MEKTSSTQDIVSQNELVRPPWQSLVNIEFLLIGDKIDFDDITAKLGFSPTTISKKGEPCKFINKCITEDCWEYSTGNIIEGDAGKLLREVCDLFKAKNKILKFVVKKYKTEIRINVVIYIKNGDIPGLYFEKDIIKFFYDIGAEIDVDMYVCESDAFGILGLNFIPGQSPD